MSLNPGPYLKAHGIPGAAATVAVLCGATLMATPASAASHATWKVGDCRLSRADGYPVVRASVWVRNRDRKDTHTYELDVVFGKKGAPIARYTAYVGEVRPLETGKSRIVDQNPSAGVKKVKSGTVPCRVVRIVDYYTGETVRP
ncbi:hypothetical protein PV410_12715 [Streptomyces sp. PA03-5A]|nr:hypothetical protein [Streptomyces sp. PA03-5A]